MGRRVEQEMRRLMQVYLVMGSSNCPQGVDPQDVLREALAGGVTLFQFREKGAGARTGAERVQLALQLKAICHEVGVPFIVNDDVDLALEVDADGVHIGQEDGQALAVRKRIGDSRILGVSTHNAAEALQAVEDGADYIGLGPIYATGSKADAKIPAGLAVIEEVRRAGVRIPLVAIGGIQMHHAADVVGAGADGVAVISAICQADSPREAAEQLRQVCGTPLG